MYPRMIIDLAKIEHNARTVVGLCASKQVKVTGITKGVCGDGSIAKTLVASGVNSLGDTRIANLKRLAALPCEKWLIRIPMISEIEQVIQYADVSLVSEKVILDLLNTEALRQKRIHGIMLMIDMGDRREGCVDADELLAMVQLVEQKPALYLKGIGTNLGCFGFVQTDQLKITEFGKVVHSVFHDLPMLMYSAGNSSGLSWLLETQDHGLVNHFRLGEALLFGRERRDFSQLPGTYADAFLLQAEVVEVKYKSSLPSGRIGRDSFGNVPHFTDAGIHCRAICAVGKQDIEPDTLIPVREDIHILGASYDHMMVEVQSGSVTVGDILSFQMRYPAVVRAMTGEYVEKDYVRPYETDM